MDKVDANSDCGTCIYAAFIMRHPADEKRSGNSHPYICETMNPSVLDMFFYLLENLLDF